MNTQITRFLFGATIALAIALVLIVLPTPTPARAGGTVTTCNEAGLVAALAGGGTVTFNCGGINSPATITLTSQQTITASTTINGGSVITLSGGSSTSLFLVNSSVTLTLSAITITQGYKSGNGGCIYAIGILVLNNVTMTNCHAAGGKGGGLYVESAGRATVSSSTLSGNTAVGNDTGDCTPFTHAGDGFGGAIYNAGMASVSNSTLSGNSASGGYSFCMGYGGGGGGGGIALEDGTATLINVALNGNSAIEGWGPTAPGGGIGGGILSYSGTLTLTNSTVYSNTSTGSSGGGGGIYNFLGTATLTNVTLSGNSSSFTNGGGIYNNIGTATLTNVTISNNSASTAGGIYKSAGTVTPTNTIVANSTGGNCSPSLGGNFNLSSDGTCGFGMDRDNVNVMLGPLANNGGPTKTHLPLPGSPAIDFGTNTGCPPTDQRGATRPIGNACDVGAVETSYLFLPLILK